MRKLILVIKGNGPEGDSQIRVCIFRKAHYCNNQQTLTRALYYVVSNQAPGDVAQILDWAVDESNKTPEEIAMQFIRQCREVSVLSSTDDYAVVITSAQRRDDILSRLRMLSESCVG